MMETGVVEAEILLSVFEMEILLVFKMEVKVWAVSVFEEELSVFEEELSVFKEELLRRGCRCCQWRVVWSGIVFVFEEELSVFK